VPGDGMGGVAGTEAGPGAREEPGASQDLEPQPAGAIVRIDQRAVVRVRMVNDPSFFPDKSGSGAARAAAREA
jgi:hypothetical protein